MVEVVEMVAMATMALRSTLMATATGATATATATGATAMEDLTSVSGSFRRNHRILGFCPLSKLSSVL